MKVSYALSLSLDLEHRSTLFSTGVEHRRVDVFAYI